MDENRIIAEFMGVDPFIMDALDTEGNSFLNYDKSWNALMPVVEKIKKIAMNKNVPYCSDVELGAAICKITALSIVCSIEQVYYAVLEFINWYNTLPNGTTNE